MKKPIIHSYEINPLSEEAYQEAPEAVRKVYIAVVQNIPLSKEVIKATVDAYPGYFTLKKKQVKNSFSKNFKRLSNLKQLRDSLVNLEKNSKVLNRPSISFARKDEVQFPTNPTCAGNCGMSYCDDNGCIDRKRELVGGGIPSDLGYIYPNTMSGTIKDHNTISSLDALQEYVDKHGEDWPLEKGEYNGKCNITTCQTEEQASWYNHSTRKFYCPSCANRLNYDEFNLRDAKRMFGHMLCTEGIPKLENTTNPSNL